MGIFLLHKNEFTALPYEQKIPAFALRNLTSYEIAGFIVRSV